MRTRTRQQKMGWAMPDLMRTDAAEGNGAEPRAEGTDCLSVVTAPVHLLVAAIRRAHQLAATSATRDALAMISAINAGSIVTIDAIKVWKPAPANLQAVLPAIPEAAPRAPRRSSERKFLAWVRECVARKEPLLPDDDPVYVYAAEIRLPAAFIELAWAEFAITARTKGKVQRDWRAHFRDSVRRGWQGLWRIEATGAYVLTTAGRQAWAAHMDGAPTPGHTGPRY